MRTAILGTCVLALLGVGCTDAEPRGSGGSGSALSSEAPGDRNDIGGPPDITVSVDDADDLDEGGEFGLDCPRGPVGAIRVVFDCDEITVYSCKDLSNVVLELEDGTRQRVEGLSGRTATFAAAGDADGARIVRTWVKAGANHSGDGPGYGERFEAPEDDCDDGGGGAGGAGGTGGSGGSGGDDPCVDNDPDTFCDEGPPPEDEEDPCADNDPDTFCDEGPPPEDGEGPPPEDGDGPPPEDEDPCADNDPDTFCDDDGVPSEDTVPCIERPDDPDCRVD